MGIGMTDLRRIIWLASYPKSGNTWMRTLLAHYLFPPGKAPDINNLRQFTTGDSRKDIYNAAAGGDYRSDNVEEWVKMRQNVVHMIAASKPNKHFVKTHCQPIVLFDQELVPARYTAAAIYIMRNPFDLAPSFARHQSCDIDTAIDRMMDPNMLSGEGTAIYEYFGRWDIHVDTWTNAPGLPKHVIRYEDMLADTHATMRGLLADFMKVPLDEDKLAEAIKATSFEALKKQEEEKGFRERPKGMQSFFAKGQAGVWRDDLTPAQIARLREAFKPTLEKWYPELLKDTAAFLDKS